MNKPGTKYSYVYYVVSSEIDLFSYCLWFYAALSTQCQPIFLIMYDKEYWIQPTAKINTREFNFLVYLSCRRYIGMTYIWLYCKPRIGSLAYLNHKNLFVDIVVLNGSKSHLIYFNSIIIVQRFEDFPLYLLQLQIEH